MDTFCTVWQAIFQFRFKSFNRATYQDNIATATVDGDTAGTGTEEDPIILVPHGS